MDEVEYLMHLDQKLQEELDEYNTNGEIEELADIVEVIYAILLAKGVSIKDFEVLRLNKQADRGAFEKRLFLEIVDDDN